MYYLSVLPLRYASVIVKENKKNLDYNLEYIKISALASIVVHLVAQLKKDCWKFKQAEGWLLNKREIHRHSVKASTDIPEIRTVNPQYAQT